MIKYIIILIVSLSSLTLFAEEVHQVEAVTTEGKNVIMIKEPPQDIYVPEAMWTFISLEEKPNIIFVPVQVNLKQKNEGILISEDLHIHLPRGGGEVDLSRYITDKQGSFYLNFDFEKSSDEKGDLKVFFISRSKKRKLDGEIHGAGCKTFFDVTKYFSKAINTDPEKGLRLNTTRLRHLSVIGGTFIFAMVKNKDVKIAQVTFKDSKNNLYFCPDVQMKEKKKVETEHAESVEGL